MSRATFISVDMKELSTVWWNYSLTKKNSYICKRCSNTFPENSQFHRHKLLCNRDGQDDPKITKEVRLSKEQAEEAASAVLLEYSGRLIKKELIVSERKTKNAREKSSLENIPVDSPNETLLHRGHKKKRQVENQGKDLTTTQMLSLSSTQFSSGFKGFRIPKKNSSRALSQVNALDCEAKLTPLAKIEVETSDYGSNSSSSETTDVSSLSPPLPLDILDEEENLEIIGEINEDGELIPAEGYVLIQNEELLEMVVEVEDVDENEETSINQVSNTINIELLKEKDEPSIADNCQQDENQQQQILIQEVHDLELGAEEIVESGDSSFSQSEDFSYSEASIFLSQSIDLQFQHKTKKITQEKKSLSPSNHLISVLEKTLLVKVNRCDNMRPSQHQRLKKVEPDYLATSPPASPTQETVIIQKLKENSESTKKYKESRPTPPKEKWAIVGSNLSPEESLIMTPLKLKIKRRRDHPDNLDEFTNALKKPKQQNTQGPQFFEDICNICGTECKFEDAKTYYISKDVSKPFACCTCFNTYSESEWEYHNEECCTTEHVEEEDDYEERLCINEQCNKPLKKKLYEVLVKRDFICQLCFKSMSNLK